MNSRQSPGPREPENEFRPSKISGSPPRMQEVCGREVAANVVCWEDGGGRD